MTKEKINVSGMSCSHCEKAVVNALLALSGVKSADADAKKGIVKVEFDTSEVSIETIKSEIEETGYTAL